MACLEVLEDSCVGFSVSFLFSVDSWCLASSSWCCLRVISRYLSLNYISWWFCLSLSWASSVFVASKISSSSDTEVVRVETYEVSLVTFYDAYTCPCFRLWI